MGLVLDLNDFISSDFIKKIEKRFECKGEELTNKIVPAFRASIEECCMMLEGKSIQHNTTDLITDKAWLIIKHTNENVFLDERDLSSFLCLSMSESEEILRRVLLRYGPDIQFRLDNKMYSILLGVKRNKGVNYLIIKSIIVLDEMNQLLNRIAPSFKLIEKVEGRGSLYKISDDSLGKMIQYFQWKNN